jgi:hypothetical protein
MTLRTIDADPRIVDRMRVRLQELIAESDFPLRRPRWPRTGHLEIALPHLVYGLSARSLAGFSPLTSAQPASARFLVYLGGTLVAAAELPLADRAEIAVTDGPQVEGTADAVKRAEVQDNIDDAEVRLLRASPLYFVALWLHADSGDDRFVPLPPTPDGVKALRVYTADELAQPLAAAAGRLLRTHVPIEP